MERSTTPRTFTSSSPMTTSSTLPTSWYKFHLCSPQPAFYSYLIPYYKMHISHLFMLIVICRFSSTLARTILPRLTCTQRRRPPRRPADSTPSTTAIKCFEWLHLINSFHFLLALVSIYFSSLRNFSPGRLSLFYHHAYRGN